MSIALRNLRDVGFPGGNALMNPQAHNWYNRHQLRITNQASNISVPLAFDGGGNATAYIVGGARLRDLSGEPTGSRSKSRRTGTARSGIISTARWS